MKQNRKQRPVRKFGLWILIIAVLAILGAGAYFWKPWADSEAPVSETAEVRIGDYVDYVELRGEVNVQSSTLIKAPYNAGELQILKLVRNGAQVKKGDIVVEFDSSSLQRTMDRYRAALVQAETEIERLKAQQRMQQEKNLTEAVAADFALERARLDLGTRDIIPAIEYDRNVLAVEKAEQKIQELKTKAETYRIGAEADLAGAVRRREKAKSDLEKAERNLGDLTLRSPIDGTINILPNSRIRSSILSSGGGPVFKEGDRLWAGASVAEIPDISTIQATAPVFEAERGRIRVGQQVLMRVEAVPDRELKGVVRTISPITKVDYTTYPYRKSFEMQVDFIEPDPRLKPGMTGTIQVEVERLPDSIMIPTEAVFDKDSRMVAYVASSTGYEERTLQLSHRSSRYVRVTEGVEHGERVALKDPTVKAE
jgi:HlyD family secretion protein